MATWNELVKHVKRKYDIEDEGARFLKLVFNVGVARSQVVFLNRCALLDGNEEWVQIESPIGRLADVDLRRAVEEVGGVVCGGLACAGDVLTLRHSVPLDNLDLNEFERPLELVTTIADRLETRLTGDDQF